MPYALDLSAAHDTVLQRELSEINATRQANGLSPIEGLVIVQGIIEAWIATKQAEQDEIDARTYRAAFVQASPEEQAAILAILEPYLTP